MTISAMVYCTCYREGRAKPFPLPELEGYFQYDEAMNLGLLLPWDETYAEAHHIVHHWIEHDACEHAGMAMCTVELATDNGYFHFYEQLGRIGWAHFPTLYQYLPQTNTGYMLAQDAAIALRELHLFNGMGELGGNVVLAAVETNSVIWEHAGRWVSQIEMDDSSLDMGIDEQGFYVTHAQSPYEVLFRAVWFGQAIDYVPSDAGGSSQRVTFSNLETGEQFISPIPIDVNLSADGQLSFPQQLVVQSHVVTPADYAYIVVPLMQACEAAVATGNPILWG